MGQTDIKNNRSTKRYLYGAILVLGIAVVTIIYCSKINYYIQPKSITSRPLATNLHTDSTVLQKQQPIDSIHKTDAIEPKVAAKTIKAKSIKSDSPLTKLDVVKAKSQVKESLSKLPLRFELNQGQVEKDTEYVSYKNGYKFSLCKTEVSLTVNNVIETKEEQLKNKIMSKLPNHNLPLSKIAAPKTSKDQTVLTMQLRDSNPSVVLTGEDKLLSVSNYFIGNNDANWLTNIPNYSKVRYQNIYSGIDMVYYGNGQSLEYDFIVSPGADPAKIRMQFKEANKIDINDKGDLLLVTENGQFLQHKPIIFQEVDNTKIVVPGNFKLLDDTSVAFQIAAYDITKPLFIDPEIVFAGSIAEGYIADLAIDDFGNFYFIGNTDGTEPAANSNVIVSKISADGTSLVYTTHIVGSYDDRVSGIAVNSLGQVFIAGTTYSNDFPTLHPYQPASQTINANAFICKLGVDGTSMIFSTYLGGESEDSVSSICLDGNNDVYIAGYTISTNFPISSDAFQKSLNCSTGTCSFFSDAFVSKLHFDEDNNILSLAYSTYLGGGVSNNINGVSTFGGDFATSIVVDIKGGIYVVGYTNSFSFPLVNPIQSSANINTNPPPGVFDSEMFLSKFDPNGNLLFSTYLGGSKEDFAGRVIVDYFGNAYITGITLSPDLTIVNGYQPMFATPLPNCDLCYDAFLIKIDTNPIPKQITYSTYIGGNYFDYGSDIQVDRNENVYVAVETGSTNLPQIDQIANCNVCAGIVPSNFAAGYLTKINTRASDLDSLVFASYFEAPPAIRLRCNGDLFFVYQATLNFTNTIYLDLTPGIYQVQNPIAFLNAFGKIASASPGTLQFGLNQYSVNENCNAVRVGVTRLAGTNGIIKVDYTINSGNSGGRVASASGTLTFNDGEVIKGIDVPVLDDDIFQGNGTFQVMLSNPQNRAIIGNIPIITVTIFDDESQP